MTTPLTTRRTHALVSSLAVPLAALAFAGCAAGGASPRAAAGLDARAPAPGALARIRFDNESRERVHVYLVSETADWLLGPVEPGTHAWLPLPRRALGELGTVRLVALPGARITMQASRDPRAVVSLGHATGELLQQRWVFAQGQLSPMRLR